MAYQRKTRDYYEVQGYYGNQYGWECVTAEDTYKAAKVQLKCYDDNEPQYPHRIVKRREKIEGTYQ